MGELAESELNWAWFYNTMGVNCFGVRPNQMYSSAMIQLWPYLLISVTATDWTAPNYPQTAGYQLGLGDIIYHI